MQNNNIAVIILILLLFGLGFFLTQANSKLNTVESTVSKLISDRKAMMDSIEILTATNASLNETVTIYKDSVESLSKYKSKVIIKYRDQKNFVSDATMAQLDSIIRANTTIIK